MGNLKWSDVHTLVQISFRALFPSYYPAETIKLKKQSFEGMMNESEFAVCGHLWREVTGQNRALGIWEIQ